MANANTRKQVGRMLANMGGTGAYMRGKSNPKSVFIDAGKSVLRYLAKDLGLTEFKVWHNAGGPAVPGDVTLIGLWSDGNGIYVNFTGYGLNWYQGQFMYRTVKHMRDYSGGGNRWTNVEQLRYDWPGVVKKLRSLDHNLDSHEQADRKDLGWHAVDFG